MAKDAAVRSAITSCRSPIWHSRCWPPLRALNAEQPGPFVSPRGGALHSSTVSHVVHAIWEALAAEDRAEGRPVIEKFCFKDLRRTCETLLGSMGVSLDHRSYVLSHGRSGVQKKHYDRWAYLAEKRRALNKWAKFLRKNVLVKPHRPAKPLNTEAPSREVLTQGVTDSIVVPSGALTALATIPSTTPSATG